MNEIQIPAIAVLKQANPHSEQSLRALVAQLLADKGIGQQTVGYLAQQSPQFLGTLFGHLIMRSPDALARGNILRRSFSTLTLPSPTYLGTRKENVAIDASWQEPGPTGGLRNMTWRGTAGAYECNQLKIPARIGSMTRIVIIGAGAAGVFAARALTDMGFTRILLLDQTGRCGGIWNQDGLIGASRANPFPLRFETCQLEAAPGPGEAVKQWVLAVAKGGVQPFPQVVKGRVLAVTPGDVAHRVLYENEAGELREIVAPIVINASGVGEPLPPSREGVMTTDVAPEHAGVRWQQVWSKEQAKLYGGHSLIFISLSNSTLEMVKQIQRYRREGLDIDYQIMTHYPNEALAHPSKVVTHRGHRMRLYREPARHQLLRLAGDLPEVAAAFEEARDTGHITSHVIHWSLEGCERQVVALLENGGALRFPCHELYTLIGYGPRAERLKNMGLSVNHPYLGAVDLDYDGEVQREMDTVGRQRLWPGYFCLGIRNAFNMNEVLLPGLLFRLPDLMATLILRSIEHYIKSQRQ